MANKTINEIDNTVTSVASGDYLPIWDTSAGKTGKITRGNLVSGLQSTLTFDNYPTKNSSNPVKSSGVFATNAVIMASSKTITSAPTISSGSVIRVMFTSAITGSDTTTALSLSYNGTSYSVKVGKQGALTNFVASYVNSAYTYLQAYTTLELAFDGTQFIIIGNPVVLSSSDYTIYADGEISYNGFTNLLSEIYPAEDVKLSNDSSVTKHNGVVSLYINFTLTKSFKKNDVIFTFSEKLRSRLLYIDMPCFEHQPDILVGFLRFRVERLDIVTDVQPMSAGTYRFSANYLAYDCAI